MSYLVLYVRPYDFKNKQGEHIQGATLTYLDLSMEPTGDERGHAPLNLSVDRQTASQFTTAPAFYDLDFRQKRGKDGKPQIVLVGGTLSQPVNFAQRPAKPAA